MRIALLALPCILLACGGEPVKLAEQAEKLEIQAPKSKGARRYVIDGSGGQLGFDMEAPIEKIRGRVPSSAVSGEIFVDPADLARTTGLVHVDLSGLELFQRKAAAEGEAFGEETKNETQNKHARDWLEIGADVPPDVLKKNSVIEFSLREVGDLSATDLGKLTGPERKVTFTATGEFLLHQRKASKSVKLEAVFTWAGDQPTAVKVRSLEPLEIGLDEYDVHPREGFGKLAAKTLQVLSPKVAKAAAVHLEFTARLAPDASPTMQSVAAGAAPAVPGQPPSGAPYVEPDVKAADTKSPPKSPAKPG
jgi:hypothetical protein